MVFARFRMFFNKHDVAEERKYQDQNSFCKII